MTNKHIELGIISTVHLCRPFPMIPRLANGDPDVFASPRLLDQFGLQPSKAFEIFWRPSGDMVRKTILWAEFSGLTLEGKSKTCWRSRTIACIESHAGSSIPWFGPWFQLRPKGSLVHSIHVAKGSCWLNWETLGLSRSRPPWSTLILQNVRLYTVYIYILCIHLAWHPRPANLRCYTVLTYKIVPVRHLRSHRLEVLLSFCISSNIASFTCITQTEHLPSPIFWASAMKDSRRKNHKLAKQPFATTPPFWQHVPIQVTDGFYPT